MTTQPTSFGTARANAIRSPIRVMVVDDSAVIRGVIRRILETDNDLEIVASLANGRQAVDELRRRGDVDVVVLDVEMPVMDGLSALAALLEIDRGLQVIMASTLTQRNAEISIRALELGATDYVPKPTAQRVASSDDFARELLQKVKTLGAARRRRRQADPARPSSTAARGRDEKLAVATRPSRAPSSVSAVTLRVASRLRPEVFVIGSSTGGPQALLALFQALPFGCFPQPILIAQHMPATFTTILAEHLQRHSGWPCAEANDGDMLRSGRLYLARGDFHLLVERLSPASVRLRLSKAEPENFCRPAVDPLLRSVTEVFGARAAAVILTGMGSDGCKGSRILAEAGGTILAQDEQSSVVWGMPGAVANAGLCTAVQPLTELARTMISLATRPA